LSARSALVIALLALVVPSRASSQADGGPPNRTSVVIEALHRSGAAQRCWNAFLHANPDSGSVRLRVRVEVSASGGLERVTFLEPAPEPLTNCVRAELRRFSVAAGPTATVETTYSFSAGVPAPVPAEH
jgi:hypothetical protein